MFWNVQQGILEFFQRVDGAATLQVELISSRCTHHKTAPEIKLS
jgi:hypothetical protein